LCLVVLESPLRVQVFGPVRAWRGNQEVDLGPPQQRAVLAALALRARRSLTRDELVDMIWGENSPASAANIIHTYVKGLRKALEPDRAARDPGTLLLFGRGGYALMLDPDRLDAHVFERRLALGRDLLGAGDLAEGRQVIEAALRLADAPPLSGIDSLWADSQRARFDELKQAGLESRAEAMLAAGDDAEAARQLAELTAQHPFREHLHALFMLALYRCGRRADALSAFAAASTVLSAELGVEPGAELRRLHHQVLTADPALDRPGAGEGGASRSKKHRVPAQLPAGVRDFTGRRTELIRLDRDLAELHAHPDGSRGAVITLISGPPGVGKTALAVRWAHLSKVAFPDGQLYVDLRGYDPEQPLTAAGALGLFLRALGLTDREIPAEIHERAACFRTAVDGQAILLVLDNAATVEQVRPLLPGTPGCMVLVTSRDSLPALVARHGASRLDLDLLPPGDAVALLTALIGPAAAAAHDAVAELAERCSRLPLALRVAAERVAARPQEPIADVVAELADGKRRLDLLGAVHDQHTAVRDVFSWSCRQLPAPALAAFRLLSLHPGPDFDAFAIAAIGQADLDAARGIADVLAAAHLIAPAGPARFALHDLLRAYAADLSAAADPAPGRDAARTRLYDYYLAGAAAAMDLLVPAERHRRPEPPAIATPRPPLPDREAARRWLDSELAVLTAVCVSATASGRFGYTTRLAATLYRYLDSGGHYLAAVAIHSAAYRAACATGDQAAEAIALTGLGTVSWRQGDHDQATSYHQRALAGFRAAADKAGEARTLTNLSIVDWRQGRYERAAQRHAAAVGLFAEVGDRFGEARALSNLGLVYQRQGRYPEAAQRLRRALAIFTELGDPLGEAHALGSLGAISSLLGSQHEAHELVRQALTLLRSLADRGGEASALAELGAIYYRQGQLHQAEDHHYRALAIFREIGDRSGESEVLNSLGDTLAALGQAGEARARHTAALSLAVLTGDEYEQARAHDGLARTFRAEGDLTSAREHWQLALARYTKLGVPARDEVRARLDASGPPSPHAGPP
jgi:DNA-binding SARP family transcriptional activator